jgi:hypothetical protein
VLELAAGATARKGARQTTPNHVDVEPPRGVKHDAKSAGGGSQTEERYGPAAEVLKINRHRNSPVRRVSVNIPILKIFRGRRLHPCVQATPLLAHHLKAAY